MHLLTYFSFWISLFDIDLSTFYLKESEVIIEELQDDDSFEYANMPALINLPSQVFLSHTQPPFIYQYVGDQVKILQVLGNFPLDANVDKQTDSNRDHRDQKDINTVKPLFDNSVEKDHIKNESITIQEDIVKENDIVSDIPVASQQKDNNDEQCSTNKKELEYTAKKEIDSVSLLKTVAESTPHSETSIETSEKDNDSVESDDEASFGTPDHSPKSKRKFPKGKYGKGKAPPPPKDDTDEVTDVIQDILNKSDTETIPDSILSQESSVGDESKLPNISIQEAVVSKGLAVNPSHETKKRHKSKSPARAPKGSSSGFGKLLQLPGKLAFWNKSEEKPKSDSTSTSSDDNSRRSSTIERTVDDFQSCTDLNTLVDGENKALIDKTELQEVDNGDDQNIFADASDLGDAISDKSNALQRLIEAKIESHPEYKIISLHDNTPTTSKSTDV